MKSAKPPAVDGPSSRRSQPVRQARTNPSRVSNLRRPIGGRDSLPGASSSDQPIDIFPAVTHFADAITALPKELVRHFTLLKEVDAKIFAPEETLFNLVDAAMAPVAAAQPPAPNEATTSLAPVSATMSAQNSSTGVAHSTQVPPAPSVADSHAPSASGGPNPDPRRQLYQQVAIKIQEMLGSLEEKNHVISTANDALQKQLARIDEVWPHVENEFSDEAKWGSTTHWAYPENRAGNKAAHAERSRREGAAAISAAAQALADEAAARSDARKQAVQAKKNLKTQNHDMDLDDNEGRGKTETTKKGAKARKTAADAASGAGLGVATNGATNGTAPQPKRRKVEKPAAAAAPADRALAGVFGTDAPKTKTSSPRGTPAPEGPKKRKALPSGSGQAKKSRNGVTGNPTSATSSPVIGAFPDAKLPRGSPVPLPVKAPVAARARQNSIQSTADANKLRPSSSASNKPNGVTQGTPDLPLTPNWPRPGVPEPKPTKETTTAPAKPDTVMKDAEPAPVAARARQNSIQSTADANKLRPSSSASNKPNGVTQGTSDLPLTPNWPRPGVPEPKPTKETTTAPAKPDTVMKDAEPVEPLSVASTPATSKKELPTVPKQEEMDRKSEPVPQIATAATVTKSGRASKPSTPALPNFPDAVVRSRTSRNADGKDASKRKKSTSTTAVQAAQTARSIEEGARNGSGGVGVGAAAAPGEEEEGDIDADEPRYCYCNSVSYGEMVACDADTCEREWFHLECVGLKVAPKGNAKWFCEPCKKRLTAAGKKVNGR
ncbi:hypothetical protein BN1723_006451 [Verticillium longisporum]|uniref:Chromatin modification-related protein n=2 Tax=Verticillium longisporum TaxID=100787 RepID=A0A0G4NEQ0_VERLO|nr:hypothetical protein BN1723_006451 [Verticillium longisporum]